eukprot:45942_1
MSTETKSVSKWNELASFPFKYFSQPFVTNSNEFIVAAYKTIHSNGDAIYKFDTNKNEWIKIFDYDKNSNFNIRSAAYDNKNKLLYIGDTSKILAFDLKTKNVTTLKEQYKRFFGLIFAENKLHQICSQLNVDGTCSNFDHYVYDKTKHFQKITTFPSFFRLHYYNALIYLTVHKCILLFGGWNINGGYQHSIYRFSCINSKWKELHIKIPTKVSRFGLVSTKNEQYIIILGGYIFCDHKYSDDIFIYDIRNNIFSK